MPPEKAGRKWRFCVKENGIKRWISYADYNECYEAWTKYINRAKSEPVLEATIQTIEEYTDIPSLWEYVEANQESVRKDIPRIQMPDRPFAIAFLSDLHLGASGTDYKAIKKDAETIANTDGMYAIFHGDGIDNWILPKMQGLQRKQMVPFDMEIALFAAWIQQISPKLLCVVAGNHDNWTKKMSGIDLLKNITPPDVLYDEHQILFDLLWGNNSLRFAIRHHWRGSTQANPTGGMEKASKEIDADVFIAGHTHIGTLFRSFISRGKDRVGVLTGTYKHNDEYARELGFVPSHHSGCGAIVVDTDGSMVWIRSLDEAARYLKFKQQEYDDAKKAEKY